MGLTNPVRGICSVITVYDSVRENCPWFPAQAMLHHHDFQDPAKAVGSNTEVMAEFRRVRDQLKDYCQAFVRAYC